eukprot:37471_1
MNFIQFHCNTTTIDVLCRDDSTSSTFKTIIDVSGQPMHYVWYNMPQNATIQDLLCKIRKIYRLNLSSIDGFDASTVIRDVPSHDSQSNAGDPWRCIDVLTVNILNANECSNHLEFKLSSVLSSNENDNLLKDNIYSFLHDTYCPLQCEIRYNDSHSTIFNDIPDKQQMLEFLSNIPHPDIVSNQLSMNISLPSIRLKINHDDQILYFYGFPNILFLCDDQFEEHGSKIINNKYQITYNDVLEMLNVDGHTFMDPENQYLELDLYQPISPSTNVIASLQTISLSINKCTRCVICQQDNVTESEFTRINCCEHQYHYSCIKQYIQHNAKSIPQCPLCREPFTLIQVHNNLILQTIQVNHSEFKSDHELQEDTLFSDLEDDGELITVALDPLPQSVPFFPNFDDLDEFYRVGLSIINSNSNADIDIDHDQANADDSDSDEDAPQIYIEEDDRYHDEMDRDQISKSSCSDKIGALSLSGVSTSATQSNNRRPSLRYIYSPIPYSDRDSPIGYSPTPTVHSRKNRSLSGSLSPFNNYNDNVLNVPSRCNEIFKLCPIDSCQSLRSHLFDAST